MAPLGVTSKLYRPRNPLASPFHRLVTRYFEEFERVYPERFQETYGFWRPVIKASLEKFIKCGDLKEGFARVKCRNCGKELFVAYSCRQRCACPSCHQKRMLLVSTHLDEEVLAHVPHRQYVFTIPKRLRIYFRYDRKLLGDLARAAWETVRDLFQGQADGKEPVVPAMVAGIQSYGDIINFHPHIHALVPCGFFTQAGGFTEVDILPPDRLVRLWQEKVFGFLLEKGLVTHGIMANMRAWQHSGFSVDQSIRLEADDREGMRRMIEYFIRCPFSVARMVRLTDEGKVLYRASRPKAVRFPEKGNPKFTKGLKRNFEIFEPLDFLATVTQHIPNKGEHLIHYYGGYSNKRRGMCLKEQKQKQWDPVVMSVPEMVPEPPKCSSTWALLIKHVYEVNPLKCPDCGEEMKIISFIEQRQEDVIEKILRHCGLWIEPVLSLPGRGPPAKTGPPPQLPEEPESVPYYDNTFFYQDHV